MPVYKDLKAKSKQWYFEINYVDQGKYRKKKKRGFSTKKEAEAAMTSIQNDLNKGTFVESSKVLYSDFLHDWLGDKQTSVKRQTLVTYSAIVNNHVIPSIGTIELQKLTPRHIQDLINELHKSGKLSDEYIQKVYTIVKESLNKAVSWGMLSKNVASVVERPRARKKETLIWEKEEAIAFLETSRKDRYHLTFHLAITTGMRQGEILGLRWKDVDFDRRMISVVQTLTHDGKNFQVGAKTESGNRTISIDNVTLQELLKLKRRNELEKRSTDPLMYEDHDLVICTTVGTPVTPRNLMRTFYRLIEKAGVQKIRFHDLRHSHATLLLRQNVNPKIVADRLGWASTKMIDRYSHVTSNIQRDTANAFGKMFFEDRNNTDNISTKFAPVQ